jgi:type IV secretion system protein TrbL
MLGVSILPVPCGVPGVCSGSGSITGGLSSSLASAASSAFLDVLKSSLSDAADWMVGHVIDLVNSTTTVNLTTGWFPTSLTAMRDIAILVVLPILMAASIGPVLRQDARRLFRVWGVGLPVAVLSALLGMQFVQLALALTDKMCVFVSDGSLQVFSRQFSSMMVSSLETGAPPIVAMVVSALLIFGTLVVWLELVVRTASVYLAAFFMPLALVTFIWPTTAGIAKRTLEILSSLILSKFVIVAGLTLGLSAVNSGSSTDDAVAGAAILLLSGFTPFALLRLAPVVEAAAIGHLEGLSRRPVRAASRAATTAMGARSHPAVKYLLSNSSSGGGGARTPSPVVTAPRPAAPALAERKADFPVGEGRATDG